MLTITARNVNQALVDGIQLIKTFGIEQDSRDGRTLEIEGPVATTYLRPQERVLFSEERDANPFFHLFESLWILAGRRDVKWISEFNSNIHKYSDDDVSFHGAYGYRLRQLQYDQINLAIIMLKINPDSRRVVLQIWDANRDLGVESLDIPCNDLIFLKIRNNKLNITVCCRSNDLLYGTYGANVVQFSILQEYIAAMVGVEIGVYTQISDSYHAYIDRDDWKKVSRIVNNELYESNAVTTKKLVDIPSTFDSELEKFMGGNFSYYKNTFFSEIAEPMRLAWQYHKKNKSGYKWLIKNARGYLFENDWIYVSLAWLKRRE